jgi:hypothetical protein
LSPWVGVRARSPSARHYNTKKIASQYFPNGIPDVVLLRKRKSAFTLQ